MENKIFNKIIFTVLEEDTINNGYGNCIRYEVEILHNGQNYVTTFTDSVMAYREGKGINYKDFMNCLLLDKSAYDSCTGIDDFQRTFGYEKVSECLKAYEGCKRTSEALDRLFTRDELDQLELEFENY